MWVCFRVGTERAQVCVLRTFADLEADVGPVNGVDRRRRESSHVRVFFGILSVVMDDLLLETIRQLELAKVVANPE